MRKSRPGSGAVRFYIHGRRARVLATTALRVLLYPARSRAVCCCDGARGRSAVGSEARCQQSKLVRLCFVLRLIYTRSSAALTPFVLAGRCGRGYMKGRAGGSARGTGVAVREGD